MSTVPTTVERLGDSALRVVWTDGHESVYLWALLRESCPCAVCQPLRDGSHPSRPPSPPLRATTVKPVGRYALHIAWSDGHLTGIYAFDYLRRLCPCEACRPQQFQEG
ncbi:MAG: hypothetical protein A3C53_02850 [Omnitrophica WOR_2 bacterium RIFCSPHIGHO2_02_FULL_68_15]|nr:MAG: hypothetical protein A3C53_02850 [Omnitrophica WOR_2 bacterium RIFCSPHIGHO2_02_FULL_68_15]